MVEVFEELVLHHPLPDFPLPFLTSLHPYQVLSESYIAGQGQLRRNRVGEWQILPFSLRHLLNFVIVDGVT